MTITHRPNASYLRQVLECVRKAPLSRAHGLPTDHRLNPIDDPLLHGRRSVQKLHMFYDHNASAECLLSPPGLGVRAQSAAFARLQSTNRPPPRTHRRYPFAGAILLLFRISQPILIAFLKRTNISRLATLSEAANFPARWKSKLPGPTLRPINYPTPEPILSPPPRIRRRNIFAEPNGWAYSIAVSSR